MHAPVLDAFPRRPLALAHAERDRSTRKYWLVGAIALLLLAIYWGWGEWRQASMRADLRARGEPAQVEQAQGSCTSRRSISGRNPIGCNYTIHYRVRSDEGGALREAQVYVPGEAPLVGTPPVRYDPLDPSRVMSDADVERDKPFMDWGVPILAPAIISFLAILVWFALGHKRLARAAATPKPILVPVDNVEPIEKTNILRVHYRQPDGSAGKQDLNGFGPLLTIADGREQALALLGPKDRAILLSHDLRELALTSDERSAILTAARV